MRKTLLFIILFSTQVMATARPFWTEKSNYTEAGRVYFVGVATHQPSVEKGRIRALQHAQNELIQYMQVPHMRGLTFETKRTYEEKNPDGTYNVYRLMWVNEAHLEAHRKNPNRALSSKDSGAVFSEASLPSVGGKSPWWIGIGFGTAGVPVSHTQSAFVIGLGLSVEARVWEFISTKLNTAYEINASTDTSYNGFHYGLSVPFYVFPTVYLGPRFGQILGNFRQVRGGAESSLSPVYWGVEAGIQFVGADVGGQIQTSIETFGGGSGFAGTTRFSLLISLLWDPFQ